MNSSAQDMILPLFYTQLIERGVITRENIEKTDDGFYAVFKCLSDILEEKQIRTFLTHSGVLLECNKYFDDWYFYAVPSGKDFVYSLFKLREQEYDMYAGEKADADTPGVTVSFIRFDTELFLQCLDNPEPERVTGISDEINRVVAYSGQRHNKALKKYFLRVAAQGPYLIAELYIRHIVSFTHKKGFIIVPQKYEEVYNEGLTLPRTDKANRLPCFIDENNKAAGRVVCDHERIFIKDKDNPDIFEKYAILATHTADTSFNCFAAEVRFHAIFLIRLARVRIPFIGSIYASAIRADMSIDDSEFEGNAPYHSPKSSFVNKHIRYHGDF